MGQLSIQYARYFLRLVPVVLAPPVVLGVLLFRWLSG